MTYTFSEMRAKEVINICTGERLGFVSDMTVDVKTGRILSISVPGGYRVLGILGKQSDVVIPWSRIQKIGDDLILIDGAALEP